MLPNTTEEIPPTRKSPLTRHPTHVSGSAIFESLEQDSARAPNGRYGGWTPERTTDENDIDGRPHKKGHDGTKWGSLPLSEFPSGSQDPETIVAEDDEKRRELRFSPDRTSLDPRQVELLRKLWPDPNTKVTYILRNDRSKDTISLFNDEDEIEIPVHTFSSGIEFQV